MLKIKSSLRLPMLFSLVILISSCSEEDQEVVEITSAANDKEVVSDVASRSSATPWQFDSSYSTRDDFQVDNDGNGAHNWDRDDYEDDPNDNGFDVRDYIYVNNGNSKLILKCPSGNNSRRAEYRDQTNIDLDRRNRMDLTFDIRNYNNNDELIMAQLHNDNSSVRRPYITISAEDGEIELKRSNNFTKGSGTTTSSSKIPYRTNDRYRIRMDSPNNSRSVDVRINNLDTGEQARTTFTFDSSWNSVDGSFYWKHGVYMPDGGSNNTKQRVETISFATNRN